MLVVSRSLRLVLVGVASFGLAPSLLAQAPPPPPVPAQGGAKADDNPLGWTAKAGLSYVGTGGNSEATSLGFKAPCK